MNELFAPPESGLLISYLRVSLEDENTGESESISNQRDFDRLLSEAASGIYAYKVMEVVDDGHSGTNFDRPGIKRVLELVRQRKVAAILVKDLSRFGRNYKEVGSYLNRCFPFLGVRFISVTTAMTATNTLLNRGPGALPAKLCSRALQQGYFPKGKEQPICPPAAWRLLLQRCSLRLCEKQ